MKKINFIAVLLCLTISVTAHAQLNTPRGSQQATISQRVGISDISITYSRPSVNGRDLWGALVPYGMNNLGFGTSTAAPWRAGANENTTITFSHDAYVEGKPIKAGTYGLFFEVKANNEAMLILSKDYQAWGSFYYDKKNDALRAEISTVESPHNELLTFTFKEVNAKEATASLIWGKKAFPFKVSFNVTDIVLNEFRGKSNGNFGFNRLNWEQAAAYALNNGGDLNEALGWIDGAIAGNFYSQKTFNNLAIKGQILNKLGRTDEYNLLMDEASAMANKQQLNALGYQMMNAKDYNRAVKFFKLNVANNPEDPNGYDSLGECYKTMGENKKAIKNFKKSLSMNPPANVKANSEKHLKELGAL
jgi:tetratricopeptide (TPR) repeat protein